VFPEIIGRVHRFRLAGARTARLVSRSGVPAATQAASDDHRRLGVAVSRVMLDGSQLKLTDARLGAGWHAPDGHAGATPGWRWTDGDAQLDVAGAEVLEVLVAITAQSWWSDAPFARDHTAQF